MQGWIYLKIYICEEVADEFIYSEMCGFINNLKDKKILKQWFFIRYSDPDFHIRLRIKAIEAGKLFLEISEWIEKIKKAEKIGKQVEKSQKRTEAATFKEKKLITNVNADKLLKKNYCVSASNFMNIMDQFEEFTRK